MNNNTNTYDELNSTTICRDLARIEMEIERYKFYVDYLSECLDESEDDDYEEHCADQEALGREIDKKWGRR